MPNGCEPLSAGPAWWRTIYEMNRVLEARVGIEPAYTALQAAA
jgi:hypothetical protein